MTPISGINGSLSWMIYWLVKCFMLAEWAGVVLTNLAASALLSMDLKVVMRLRRQFYNCPQKS
jgi:hypothetical protein